MTRGLNALCAVLIFLVASPALAEEPNRYGQQQVAYHINGTGGEEGQAYRGALRNVQNHINAVGQENLEVVVVLHGNGVGLLSAALDDDALRGAVSSLKGQGVNFHVCNNTLVGREIDYQDDLYDVWDDDIVPSGVAELSRLQAMGFTYVKP